MLSYYIVIFLLLGALPVLALVPTAPGPEEVFRAGTLCSLDWRPDTMAVWSNLKIDLMSGSNIDMTVVKTVVSGVDGTDSSLRPFNWTCPEVEPYSAIYFYQFNDMGGRSDAQWTTRFTISSPAGEFTSPPHSEQPNGEPIPWGFGRIRRSLEQHESTAGHAYDHGQPTQSHDRNQVSEDQRESSVVQRPSRVHSGGKNRLPSEPLTASSVSATLGLPPQFAAEAESNVLDDMEEAISRATKVRAWFFAPGLLLFVFGAV